MVKTPIALLSALSFAGTTLAASAADWQNRSIYQVITDRFAKSDGSGGDCDSGARKYCGGTWRGIINKLDYIQGMGFDAIWISPVMQNLEGETAYGEAYHGYWPQNFNALNSHFGTAADLKDLATALHQRGMYLMVDVVANHIAATASPPDLQFANYTPFNAAEDYHTPFCFITDYTNQTMVEQCSIGDASVPLVDINTENPNVVSTFNSWIKQLVSDYSIDGIRIDTVKHVRKDFWPEFVKSSGVYSLGEVFDPRYDYTGDYTNYMDAVFNYPEWYLLKQAFANTTADAHVLATSVNSTQATFKNRGLTTTSSFSENHDNPRLPSEIADKQLLKNIITWTFGNNGIPTLYYGQEAVYAGGADPQNREALWFTGYDTGVTFYKHIAKLNQARKLAISDKFGSFLSTPHTVAGVANNGIALSKYPLLTVLTNAGTGGSGSLTIPSPGYKAGTELINVASDDCTAVTVGSNGQLSVTFSNGDPQVYLPSISLNSNGLCGSKAKTGTGSVAATGSSSGAFSPRSNFAVGSLIAVVAGALSFSLLV